MSRSVMPAASRSRRRRTPNWRRTTVDPGVGMTTSGVFHGATETLRAQPSAGRLTVTGGRVLDDVPEEERQVPLQPESARILGWLLVGAGREGSR